MVFAVVLVLMVLAVDSNNTDLEDILLVGFFIFNSTKSFILIKVSLLRSFIVFVFINVVSFDIDSIYISYNIY